MDLSPIPFFPGPFRLHPQSVTPLEMGAFSHKEKHMSKLTGKVAGVTGPSKGIGAAIAKALAAKGASVVVNYASSKAGAETVVVAITAAGGKAVAVGGDVQPLADLQRRQRIMRSSVRRVDCEHLF